ncbi:restriction endonuclease subunit S [Hydrogenovibrio kuenenii]|uniref:restriction endonuclease subunit S n=1 Tax=Hydrogenovibrio kuenenii TaxID=63658 RepID=UPI0004AD3CA1|nr:restriction endonuclease subunit S [Hydrogenovibrio kuenenii]
MSELITRGKHKLYSEYFETGLDWLGRIPQSWQLSRLGQYFVERREKVNDTEFPPLSVTKNGIVPQLDNAAKTDAGDNRKKVCIGDFVINSRSDRKGSSGLSALEGSVSLISIVLQPRSFVPQYALHLLKSQPFQEEFYRFGKGIVADLWSTNYSEMKNILIPVPSQAEQKSIANFLDRETHKIDTLIEKQQKLIELLKEKRKAVIGHAVTKGLNLDVPMKDSGIEWLGEVPEHWEVVKCGYLGKLFGSESINEELINNFGDIPFIKVSSLSLDSFEISEKQFFVDSSLVVTSRAKSNYVVFPKRGAAIFTNKVNIVNDKSFIDPNLMGWELSNKVLPEYVAYLLKLRGLSDIADVSTVPQINNKHIEPMKFPLPNIDEQSQIVGYLKNQTQKIDTLIDKSQQAIELLKERKTALISAAVTGKINVSDYDFR